MSPTTNVATKKAQDFAAWIRNIILITFVIALFRFTGSETWQNMIQSEDTVCDQWGNLSAEVLERPQSYDYALALGCEALRKRDYDQAEKLFAIAGELYLFEFPNFDSLPLYAYAQFHNGKRAVARETLRLAELTQRVYSGELGCTLNEQGVLELSHTGFGSSLESQAARRMCGEIYLGQYANSDPKKRENDALELQFILDLKEQFGLVR